MAIRGRGFRILGLRSFQRDLATMPVLLEQQLAAAHRGISKIVAERAKRAAPGRTKQAIHDGGGDNAMGGIAIGPDPGHAVGTFMGANSRFGWYGAQQFAGSVGRQFKPWVGPDWHPGDESGKPYFIGDAINDALEDVSDFYERHSDIAAAKAFPIIATGQRILIHR